MKSGTATRNQFNILKAFKTILGWTLLLTLVVISARTAFAAEGVMVKGFNPHHLFQLVIIGLILTLGWVTSVAFKQE